ncbi:MFS transporter [Clostridium bowmanii]|uniref:MFS transporter n=1 Tax=Clostridium bowmanii TaxID=132925 RepID=UPI001C0CE121|nr:MFS transporter [Clostridium bowmanii]MBU3189981.1 MFS transporter [Clostridium bowmanii]MCA1074585.1 MFS transporter [Clostridium bowmanii]
MLTLLLIIIYLAFISLGLPDSILGSAWPAMQTDLSVGLSSAGIIFMIISGGTIISSLLSGKLIKHFGTGKVTFISVTMTALALFGFSVSNSFIWLCLMAIPLGLGGGSVDAALNNFVALHYKSKHMSWLHCFWGIGATLGPVIMSLYISKNNQWKKGYFTIFIIQICLVVVLFITLSLWNKIEIKCDKTDENEKSNDNISALKLPGVKLALVSFVFYCATESTAGLWGSSYLVNYKGLSAGEAARWISLFYAGITLGRLLSGFLTMKFNNRKLIRLGQVLCIIGAISLLLPLPIYFSMIGLILLGLGCAPIYPCMLHETPKRFGKSASQSIMGLQMGFAYMGSMFMPPLLGFIAYKSSIAIFPYFLLCCILIMLMGSEKINRFISKPKLYKY